MSRPVFAFNAIGGMTIDALPMVLWLTQFQVAANDPVFLPGPRSA